jgi:acetoin utilization deacetylase AcuC-like enzyme
MRLWPVARPRVAAAYHDEYVIGFDPTGPDKVLDPLRPSKVRHALAPRRYRRHMQWLDTPLAEPAAMSLIHPLPYLQAASRPAFIGEVLGIHGMQPWETEVWDSLRRIIGGTMAALRSAIDTGLPSFNLSGGFHHAWPQRAAGFCILNDIAIAVASLRAEGFDLPIAVVDLDYHHGDGTEACLVDDRATWTLSLHVADWNDTGKAEALQRHVSKDVDDAGYLQAVSGALTDLERKLIPSLVVYVAGADPWAGDQLGDMHISTEAMLKRDLLVAAWAARHRAPLAVVPAGGYGTESWRILANFIQALIRGEQA